MKKVLFFTILIVCALFLFHACDDNEWGGSVVSNTKEISGPFEIEREYNLLSKNDLLVQAEVYYADTTEEITSVAVYRICEFWDGCDVQIFVNDIDMTDKVCDVGADDDLNKPLPREIVLKQFELIERFHGYAGDLETAPPAVRSFIKLIVYKRLCDAYDGVQESSPFVEATEDTEVDDEATDEEVTKETAPAPVTTFVASEVTVSETHTETVSSTQEAQETNSSAQTTVTTETTSESSSISLTTTTSEGEIVPTVP